MFIITYNPYVLKSNHHNINMVWVYASYFSGIYQSKTFQLVNSQWFSRCTNIAGYFYNAQISKRRGLFKMNTILTLFLQSVYCDINVI